MSNPTVYSIAKSTETPDGLEEYHVMLARGTIAMLRQRLRKMPPRFWGVMQEDEFIWDAWTVACAYFEKKYNPAAAAPATYGHFCILYGIREAFDRAFRWFSRMPRGTLGIAPNMMSDMEYRRACKASVHESHLGNTSDDAFKMWMERGEDGTMVEKKHSSSTPPSRPDIIAGKREMSAALHSALDTLPARTGRLIRRWYWSDDTYAMIGHDEGLCGERVRQIIRDGKKSLKWRLKNSV